MFYPQVVKPKASLNRAGKNSWRAYLALLPAHQWWLSRFWQAIRKKAHRNIFQTKAFDSLMVGKAGPPAACSQVGSCSETDLQESGWEMWAGPNRDNSLRVKHMGSDGMELYLSAFFPCCFYISHYKFSVRCRHLFSKQPNSLSTDETISPLINKSIYKNFESCQLNWSL